MPTATSPLTHLGVFVSDPETGRPVVGLPLYAEVAIPRIEVPPTLEGMLREHVHSALYEIEQISSPETMKRIEAAAGRALTETLTQSSRLRLLDDSELAFELVYVAFKEARKAADDIPLADIPPAQLPALLAAAIREFALGKGLEVVPPPESRAAIWANPLGVLVTDHVGYASFDLARLRPEVAKELASAIETRRSDPKAALPVAALIHPYGHPQPFDALAQGRFGDRTILARLEVSTAVLPSPVLGMGPRSLQNPSLTDWLLSPTSFAASPSTLVGQDGCEELVPAPLALQEFVLRQVIRISDPPDQLAVPEPYKVAYVDDYKVSWHSLGHSLGEVLYSLPLAPGESVKLAVIDWSWDNLTRREEETKLSEELLHQTHRDRTISETVTAGLREFQHGSSFMGGVATSAGASAGANAGLLGLGAALGNAWSLGGSTASSEGSRDLVGENVQRLNDSFSQASSSHREINSTVVIQARQEEKETIQTRTFTNYNHSHTLTVLYHEVLRHYRVVVEWVRRRPAVLVQLPPRVAAYDASTLLANRHLLEPALLDPALKPGFDALDKQETIREHQALHAVATGDAPIPQYWEGDIEFGLFEFGLKSAEGLEDRTDELVMVNLILLDGTTVSRPLLRAWEKGQQTDDANVGDRLNTTWMGWFIARPEQPVKWRHLKGFEFILHDTDEWRLDRLAINGLHDGDPIELFANAEVDYWFETNGSSNTVTAIKRPGPRPAPLPPTRSPEKSLTPEERHLVNRLLDHFKRNKEHYDRVLLLAADPASVAIQFESQPWNGGTLADHVEPTPLEVFGSYVAYPLSRSAEESEALEMDRLATAENRSERLTTLPTRGVFAEGKLGHCNISEEIDNTRFWKWEEHPIPFEAPEIAPVQPVQPEPQEVSASPTSFPQSLLNIVNPSSAPDPGGLTAALSLLGTPGIFRDMSGREEVAALLKQLSDKTIDIAEAANRAREIQAKYGADLDKQQKELEGKRAEAAAGVAGKAIEAESHAKQAAEAEKARADARKADVEADRAKLAAAKEHLPPAERKPVVAAVAKKWVAQSKSMDLVVNFRHGLSKSVLDGVFNVIIEGGPSLEVADVVTSLGTGRASIAKLPAGDYSVAIEGQRTRLPNLLPATIVVPKVGTHEEFSVTINKYIELRGLKLSGNGTLRIPANAERAVLNVTAVEVSTTVAQEIDYAHEQGVHLQAELGIGAKFKDIELGSVKTGGTSIDVGTTSTKYVITVPFTYLTGGLEIAQ